MAKQLTDVLDLEDEITTYRDALFVLKETIRRIRSEYFQGQPLEGNLIGNVDDELETLSLIVDTVLM